MTLRTLRRILAAAFIVLITLLLVDIRGVMEPAFGWMAKLQFLPAVLSLNAAVIIGLLLLTLVFGRVYCSIICPLGVFQDLVANLSKRLRRKRKHRIYYSPAKTWLRCGVLAAFVICLVAGLNQIVALLAPYSAYGRMVNSFLAPLYKLANNGMANVAERVGSYSFYSVDILWPKSLPVLIVAALTLIVIVVLAVRGGRTYCNTICPVGTVLGFLSKFSLLKPVIDAAKCNKCGMCERQCKASCIDSLSHTIDYSRCVSCMSCIDACKHRHAIGYTYAPGLQKGERKAVDKPTEPKPRPAVDGSRRAFLSATATVVAATALHGQESAVDGGYAVIEAKRIPQRATPITPPGSISARNLMKHCTACQLCVSACPNDVLRPSNDLAHFMQPHSSYEVGYCRPECTRCADVCPTGAIRPIDVAQKASLQIGHAVWVRDNCVCITDGVSCGNCARHCPTGAIQMVPLDTDVPNSVSIPVVNVERCIGCGACENLCPARPFSAIYVEGHEEHRSI